MNVTNSERGQLGTGNTTNVYNPRRIELAGGLAVTAAAAARGHTLLVAADGSLWVAGDNKAGQLGLGAGAAAAHETVLRFTRVPSVPKVARVAAGAYVEL
jgi:alpha-tubulin suppressor-like RCC1 family protein